MTKKKEEVKKSNSIGALWITKGKNIKYLSGEIELNGEKSRLVVFKNSFKTDEKHPDYKIYLKKAVEGEQLEIQEEEF
jgi:hypothetical protein